VGIASGKWGCGAFRGDAHLKCIIQLMAASQVGRDLAIFTFGDKKLQEEIEIMADLLKNLKISKFPKLFASPLLIQTNFMVCFQIIRRCMETTGGL